jgi:hypothetical protein
MIRYHTSCRACGLGKPELSTLKQSTAAAGLYDGGNKLVEVMDLGIQPLANDFAAQGEHHAGYAPLKVMLCPRCNLAQLSVVVDPEVLYRNYLYVTSNSEMMRTHFGTLLLDIATEVDVKSALEIASNDGLFLSVMQKSGIPHVCGIEPAENLVATSINNGVPTYKSFFNAAVCREIATKWEELPDLIVARHVFCHIDDWTAFIQNLSTIAKPETLICIEVPWVMDMIKGKEFDTIYHEHLSYMNLGAMKMLLNGSPFHMHRVIHYPIHGGAIVIMLRRNDSKQPPHPSVETFMAAEKCDKSVWEVFESDCADLRNRVEATIHTLVSQGRTVAALGASAKSTVWIQSCGFTKEEIRFIGDTTPGKWYKLSPGTDIPVVDEGAILRDMPDYVLCFAWNYKAEILAKNDLARAKGIKFIFPVPEMSIV